MRIVISNVYGDNNKGGSAITVSLISWIKELVPDAQITMIPVSRRVGDAPPTYRVTSDLHPDVAIAEPRFMPEGRGAGLRLAVELLINALSKDRFFRSPASRAISEADVVVGKGGQAIRYGSRRGPTFFLGVWGVLQPIVLGHRLGKRTGIHAVTVGPFRYLDPTWLVARAVLRSADVIRPRTQNAFLECVALDAAPDTLKVVPDIVFGWSSIAASLPAPGFGDPAPEAWRALHGPYLAVTLPSGIAYSKEMIVEFFAGIIGALAKTDQIKSVVIVRQGASIEDSKRSLDDHVLSQNLEQRLQGVIPTTYFEGDYSIQDLMLLYSGAHAVLGGRVHSAVFGLVNGTVAFPVEGHLLHKATDILAEVNADDLPVRLPTPGTDVADAIEVAVASISATLDHRDQRLATLADDLATAQMRVRESVADVLGLT